MKRATDNVQRIEGEIKRDGQMEEEVEMDEENEGHGIEARNRDQSMNICLHTEFP